MLTDTEILIAEIDAFIAKAGIKESTFGMKVVRDARLMPRLRGGGSVTLPTRTKIQTYIATATSSMEARS